MRYQRSSSLLMVLCSLLIICQNLTAQTRETEILKRHWQTIPDQHNGSEYYHHPGCSIYRDQQNGLSIVTIVKDKNTWELLQTQTRKDKLEIIRTLIFATSNTEQPTQKRQNNYRGDTLFFQYHGQFIHELPAEIQSLLPTR